MERNGTFKSGCNIPVKAARLGTCRYPRQKLLKYEAGEICNGIAFVESITKIGLLENKIIP
jgi:hypothetical protein